MRYFNNLRIRHKLILILSGTVIVLTFGMLLAVVQSVRREVELDVNGELRTSFQNFSISEGERLEDAVLQARDLANTAPNLTAAANSSPLPVCRWASDSLQKERLGSQLHGGLDIIALISTDGRPLAISERPTGVLPDAVVDNLTCTPSQMTWKLPALQHAAQSEITNWESPDENGGSQFYQLVEVPVQRSSLSAVLVMGYRISDRFARHLQEHSSAGKAEDADNEREAESETNQSSEHIELVFWHHDGAKLHVLAGTSAHARQVLAESQGATSAPASEVRRVRREYAIREEDVRFAPTIDYFNAEGLHLSGLQSLSRKSAPFYQLEWRMALIGLLTILGGGVAALLFSAPIADPLVELAFAADAVAKGNLEAARRWMEHDQKRTTSLDEVGTLSRSFVRMVQGLRERLAMSAFLSQATNRHIQQEHDNKIGHVDRQSMVVLFSDIRKFTDFCETRDPETVIALLNEVLSQQTCIVEQYGGDINKFIGDAVFAWFVGEGRCERAIKAANEIVKALQSEFGGRSGTMVGVGIHVGDVVVGSVGSPDRKDYTAIGAVVNLAARLCSYAQPGQIIVSEAVVSEVTSEGGNLDRLTFKPLEPVQLKGFTGKMAVFDASQTAGSATDPSEDAMSLSPLLHPPIDPLST